MFSNTEKRQQEIATQRESASLSGHRTLLVMHKSAWAIDVSNQETASVLFSHECLYLPFTHSQRDRSDDISWLLGTENDAIVFDTTAAFDPRLLAACSGTLKAGGILVLLTDSFAARHTHPERGLEQRLWQHLTTFTTPSSTDPVHMHWLLIPQPPTTASSATDWQTEQRELLAQMQSWVQTWKHQQSNHPAVLILQADRGRGKSALAGQMIASLKRPITQLTAAHRRGTEVLQQHFMDNRHAGCDLTFIAIDKALQDTGDLLVIDEASNLPIATLLMLCQRYDRVVLATTVHGYEGAGRGFALRFYASLDQLGILWKRLTPVCPIRFATNDPVEGFIHNVFLLGQTEAADNNVPVASAVIEHRRVTVTELADNEALLKSVYGLLIQAHYQTTPRDLQHLLEQDDMPLWVSTTGSQVVAVAWLAVEGPIDAELHDAVLRQQRRLPDALLPQRLALSSNVSEPLGTTSWRVVRIAVQLPYRRMLVGSQLLAAIEHAAMQQGVDFLGASYGSDPGTDAFWRATGFQLIHRGFRRNPRHGLQAHCVVKSMTTQYDSIVDTAVAHTADNTAALSCERDAPVSANICLSDSSILTRFADGQRSIADTAGALCRLVSKHAIRAPGPTAETSSKHPFAQFQTTAGAIPDWLDAAVDVARISSGASRRQRDAQLRNWVAATLRDVNKRK